MKLYVPHRQRVFIKEKGLFNDLGRHKANRLYPERLLDLAGHAVMLFRPMAMSDDGIEAALDGAALTYSMGGLSDAGSFAQGPEMARRPRHPLAGHSHVRPCFRRRPQALCRRARARALVPIRSFETSRFGDFFDSYRRICRNLLALRGLERRYAALEEVSERLTDDSVDEYPVLIVFGFDADQRNGKIWEPHRDKLLEKLGKDRVFLKGDSKSLVRGISV